MIDLKDGPDQVFGVTVQSNKSVQNNFYRIP